MSLAVKAVVKTGRKLLYSQIATVQIYIDCIGDLIATSTPAYSRNGVLADNRSAD